MGAAVDVATSAVLAQDTRRNISKCEKAAVSLEFADDSLLAGADVSDFSMRSSNGCSCKCQDRKEVHF